VDVLTLCFRRSPLLWAGAAAPADVLRTPILWILVAPAELQLDTGLERAGFDLAGALPVQSALAHDGSLPECGVAHGEADGDDGAEEIFHLQSPSAPVKAEWDGASPRLMPCRNQDLSTEVEHIFCATFKTVQAYRLIIAGKN